MTTDKPIPRTTRDRWLKKLGLPDNVSTEALRALIDEQKKHSRGDGSLRDKKIQAEIRKLDLACSMLQMELDQQRGQLHQNSECEAEWARVANTIRTHFENLASMVVPDLLTLGLPPDKSPRARSVIAERVRSILTTLSRSERHEGRDE